jgi:acyl-CoA thioester hydrolase
MNIDENSRSDVSYAPHAGKMIGPTTFCMTVRVAYHETDGQRRVHHANYLNYFEQSRVEMLRAQGLCYRDFENSGLMLVVAEMSVKYRSAAEFDDLLRISTTITDVRGVRIWHRYVIDRDGEIIVEAESTIACIDRNGKVSRLPREWITLFKNANADVR